MGDTNNSTGGEGSPRKDPALEALEKELATPITKEEADVAFADIDVRRCQLAIIRQKWVTQMQQMQLQVNALDAQLLALEMDRAVLFRRAFNGQKPEAGDGGDPA